MTDRRIMLINRRLETHGVKLGQTSNRTGYEVRGIRRSRLTQRERRWIESILADCFFVWEPPVIRIVAPDSHTALDS